MPSDLGSLAGRSWPSGLALTTPAPEPVNVVFCLHRRAAAKEIAFWNEAAATFRGSQFIAVCETKSCAAGPGIPAPKFRALSLVTENTAALLARVDAEGRAIVVDRRGAIVATPKNPSISRSLTALAEEVARVQAR